MIRKATCKLHSSILPSKGINFMGHFLKKKILLDLGRNHINNNDIGVRGWHLKSTFYEVQLRLQQISPLINFSVIPVMLHM